MESFDREPLYDALTLSVDNFDLKSFLLFSWLVLPASAVFVNEYDRLSVNRCNFDREHFGCTDRGRLLGAACLAPVMRPQSDSLKASAFLNIQVPRIPGGGIALHMEGNRYSFYSLHRLGLRGAR